MALADRSIYVGVCVCVEKKLFGGKEKLVAQGERALKEKEEAGAVVEII